MNVLILTPDRVGSTLLQRLLTVYMIQKKLDRPVINLHELSNGLIKYFNDTMKQEVLGKPGAGEWGYFQSLPEIIDMLSSVDHYKTSRLAQYHLVRRKDSLDDQLNFYEYLNKNFYIISCRRQNLFEHALSWAIHAHSKQLNVYRPHQKIDIFQKIYKNGITVEQTGFENYLTNYVNYIKWTETYFNVQSYFDYDKHMDNIEDYILNLDFMKDSKNNTWEDMFGQRFVDWNTCHRMLPNFLLHDRSEMENDKTVLIPTHHINKKHWDQLKGPDWPENWTKFYQTQLPVAVKDEIKKNFNFQPVPVTTEEYQFLSTNLPVYYSAISDLEKLKEYGFLVTGIPIKLQSLHEKKQIIKNFNSCITWYNNWVEKNTFGTPYTNTELELLATQEETRLSSPVLQQLGHSTNKILGS